MDSDARDFCDNSVLCASSHQSLRKWNRRAAGEIPSFRWPVERSGDALTDSDLILQRAQVSAVSRLLARYARAVALPARVTRWCSCAARPESNSAGVRAGAAVLLPAAYLSVERDGSISGV